MQDLTSEEKTAKQMSALEDSVWVIDKILAVETPTENDLATIARNVGHIELMLSKQDMLDSGANLVPFQEAIERAKQ